MKPDGYDHRNRLSRLEGLEKAMKRNISSRVMNLLMAAAMLKLVFTLFTLFSGGSQPPAVDAASRINEGAKAQKMSKPLGGSALSAGREQCSQEFLDLINARAQEIEEQQKALKQKEADLRLLEEEIDQKIKMLKKLQRDLEGPIKQRAAEEEARLQHLAGVYSSMDPSRAAALLNKLDDDTVTRLFSIMKSKKVALILANMDPEKAARISSFLYRKQAL